MKLSPDEQLYYQRQMLLPHWKEEGQVLLKQSSVLVVGAGGLGCPAIMYLAGAGIGRIGIIDPDKVQVNNLHRQVLYTYHQIGESKAKLSANRAVQLNPFIQIQAFELALTPQNALDMVAGYDLVLDCTDNFEARYLINDACVILGKAWVFAAIHRYEAQLAIFNAKLSKGGHGATYRCLFPTPPGQGSIPNCSEAGVMGALPGIVGSYQASEAVKYLMCHGNPLVEHMLVWNVATMVSQKIKLKRSENAHVVSISAVDAHCEILPMKTISPQQLEEMLTANPTLPIIDVREPWEFDLCRIEPASLYPLSELHESSPLLPHTPADVVVYCHHGVRSKHAIKILGPLFPHIQFYNLDGGIAAWAIEVDTEMAQY